MVTLLIATRNSHKVGEIGAILGGGFRFRSLHDLPEAPEVIEDAATFAGNARKKAVELAAWLAGPGRRRFAQERGYVLADDSGLEVDALGGAPGVHSARFAAMDTGRRGNSPTAENNAKLLRQMEGVPAESRTARFRCVLALTPFGQPATSSALAVRAAELEEQTRLFEGSCEGRILFGPRGEGGFGYDPLFAPEGYTQTFAELGEDLKNRLSHRARALKLLAGALPG